MLKRATMPYAEPAIAAKPFVILYCCCVCILWVPAHEMLLLAVYARVHYLLYCYHRT
jgi:hypothetical protein